MSTSPKMTTATRLVLLALLDGETYAFRVCAMTGLKSGTVSPILERLAEARWTRDRWERLDVSREGRPARHYHRLTAAGERAARAAVNMDPPVALLSDGRC